MTSEQFQQEYRLLDRVTEGEVTTYHAQATTGAMVMAHFLRASPAGNDVLLRRLEALPPQDRRKVIAQVEVDGAPVIVTRFILDFSTLDEWLAAAGVPVAPGDASSDLATAPGEFTGAFAKPEPGGGAPDDFLAVFGAPEPPAADLATPALETAPGEFTGAFARPQVPTPAACAPPAPPPGEFSGAP
ncbi:MAG: hypothetical protein FIB01_07705, partial [Gemmatimonadetes bacterium]|nr:hypothetical protein [Gemmatimonadota bacterium]